MRDKENDREDDGDTQNYKVIDSFLHPFTHSIADGQRAATKQLLDSDRSLLPVAAQGWDDLRATEAERGGWLVPFSVPPSPLGCSPSGPPPSPRHHLSPRPRSASLGPLLAMYLLFSLSLPVFQSLLFPTCLSLEYLFHTSRKRWTL